MISLIRFDYRKRELIAGAIYFSLIYAFTVSSKIEAFKNKFALLRGVLNS